MPTCVRHMGPANMQGPPLLTGSHGHNCAICQRQFSVFFFLYQRPTGLQHTQNNTLSRISLVYKLDWKLYIWKQAHDTYFDTDVVLSSYLTQELEYNHKDSQAGLETHHVLPDTDSACQLCVREIKLMIILYFIAFHCICTETTLYFSSVTYTGCDLKKNNKKTEGGYFKENVIIEILK